MEILPMATRLRVRLKLMKKPIPALPWLDPGDPFPPPRTAWTHEDVAPGLLAAGGALDTPTLLRAYASGIFPWFSDGQPILWWSPDPRMILKVQDFKLHRSLRKTLASFIARDDCEIRMDSCFESVVRACASKPRSGQSGTWIVEEMFNAYVALNHSGHAHSVETWVDGVMVGGLYCVNVGGMVFGESMFAHTTDASKIALAALVAWCRANQIDWIDCQQNTQHLASLGATEIPRDTFEDHLRQTTRQPTPLWDFSSCCWRQLLPNNCDGL